MPSRADPAINVHSAPGPVPVNARVALVVAAVDPVDGGVVAAAVAGGVVVEVVVVDVVGTSVVVVEVEVVVLVLAGGVVDVVVEEVCVPQASAAPAAVPVTTTPMPERRATAQSTRALRKCRPISSFPLQEQPVAAR
jgi:hypothetical protein